MNERIIFQNREEAGAKLAAALQKYQHANPVVLGMPRGGVVLAAVIAKALYAPLDVIVVRKIGAPGQSEYAIGAIAPGDVTVFNPQAMNYFDVNSIETKNIIKEERREMERRLKLYRGNRPALDLKNKTVIIVDDGLATGQSALAAVHAVKKLAPRKVILAIGVCAIDSADLLSQEVDELICISKPEEFYAVGLWYRDFAPTTDTEVIQLLKQNAIDLAAKP